MKLKVFLAFTVTLLLFSISCEQQRLKVAYMPTPEYPLQARSRGVEGVVAIRMGIQPDGRVLYAVGKGINSVLVEASEKNAKGWVFRVPTHARFPLDHEVKYTFKLDKKGTPNLNPTIVTALPDSVEITATPSIADEVILIPAMPTNDSSTLQR